MTAIACSAAVRPTGSSPPSVTPGLDVPLAETADLSTSERSSVQRQQWRSSSLSSESMQASSRPPRRESPSSSSSTTTSTSKTSSSSSLSSSATTPLILMRGRFTYSEIWIWRSCYLVVFLWALLMRPLIDQQIQAFWQYLLDIGVAQLDSFEPIVASMSFYMW
eukprot:CAMPEP_0185259172 /NCGR_PEP_ID=MMETSP1359-20130426/7996_1 /TAXON_ID=552665 /ORGANISM="Bigelowiella longifila, Strain CCMP242" /LENGTH=163 /DNA_ID=CAMNT_0027844979 /DNA_START=68 /DNA_END=556 /DNA_ORIENTATION=+